MAEPTSVYTLKDMILRVAIAAKIAYHGSAGTSRPTVPVDDYNFDACLRCVNDGIKMFIANAPSNGWRWMRHEAEITFGTVETSGECDAAGSGTTLVDSDLTDTYDEDDDINGYYVYDLTQEIYALITDYTAATGTVTVAAWLDYEDNTSSLTPANGDSYSITDVKTVHGDKARYYLPDDFNGEVAGEITYAADTGRGHINWASEGEIRKRREISKNTGYPMLAAVRRSPVRRKWELIVAPSPTAADVVTFPYKMGFNDLQAVSGTVFNGNATALVTTDSHIWNVYPDNYFNGWTIEVLSGTGQRSYATVTDFDSTDGSSAVFTVASWVAADGSSTGVAPALNSTFYVCDNYKQPAGAQFDEAVMSAILARAEMEFEEIASPIPGLSNNEKFYKIDLPAAHAQDARSAPKRLGPMMPSSGRPGLTRTWTDVTYD